MRSRCATGRMTGGAFAVLLIAGLFVQNVSADILPTTGTFEGVYRKDRWGVGHFRFFIVHPGLHEILVKYDGKHIRLKVTKGDQPMNPGPAIMLAVDEVEELSQPPLEIYIKTKPGKLTAGQPFQLVVETTNTSKDGLLLYPVHVLATIRQPLLQPGQKSDDPSWLIKEYSVGQLSVCGTHVQMGGWETFQGRDNFSARGGRILLSPDASYVWVASFPKGIFPGEGELKVDVNFALAASQAANGAWKSQGNFEVRKDFLVSKADPNEEQGNERSLAVSDVSLTSGKDAWTEIQFNLRPATKKQVRVPATINTGTGQVDIEKFAALARLEGIAVDGSAIEIEALRFPERDTQNGVCQLLKLPETGVMIRGKFRKESRFTSPIGRLLLKVLTDNGIETVVLSDNYTDADVSPDLPFGPTTSGVKIRIRPDRTVFTQGEPLTFHLQVVNDSGKPHC